MVFSRTIKKKKVAKGAAALALSTGVPIILVGVSGASEILPPPSFNLRPRRTMIVSIGKPFSFEIVQQGKINKILLEKIMQEIMQPPMALVQ